MNQFPGASANGLTAVQLLEFEIKIIVLFLPLASFQQRKQAHPVHIVRNGLAVDFPESRHQIPERAHEVRPAALRDVPRPADNEGHPDAAFIDISLVPSPRAVGIEEIGVGASLEMRTVVRCENDDGVVALGGKLNVRPPYQRAFVYEPNDRDRVIQSVYNGLPLNVMYWVKNEDGTYEVLSTAGNNKLGGDDWDRVISNWLIEEFKRDTGIDLSKDPMAMQRLREAAENAKISLSNQTTTDINLPFITADATGPKHLQKSLSRAQFEQMTDSLYERTKEPCRKALADAGMSHVPVISLSAQGFESNPGFKLTLPALDNLIKLVSTLSTLLGASWIICIYFTHLSIETILFSKSAHLLKILPKYSCNITL